MKKLMSNENYHENEAKGSTFWKSIALSTLQHALSAVFKTSDAMHLGSAVHAAILEPETFDAEFAVSPKFDRRTKAGKEAFAEFQKESEGKTIIDETQMQVVEGAKKAIANHELAHKMLSGGEAEYSYFCTDEKTGIELKCRPDYVNANALIDLKTCQDASNDGFMRSCIKFGYHIQAAFYLDVYNAANGTDLKEFYFVAVETKAPFAVNLFVMGEQEIEVGRKQYRAALDQYAEFLKAEKDLAHYGYSEEINEIQFPIWALEKLSA